MPRKFKFDKGRLAQFVPLLKGTMDGKAWRHLSHAAQVLYIALKRRVPKDRNKAYLAYAHAEKELMVSSHHKLKEWFKKLEHYGFIVLADGGCLGVDGKGKAPLWRLTELGVARASNPKDVFEAPTCDFLRWHGELFDPKPYRQRSGGEYYKKQNPSMDGHTEPVTTATPRLVTTHRSRVSGKEPLPTYRV